MLSITNIIIYIVFIIGIISLQIFLSKKPNERLGRILPIITFTFSIFYSIMCFLSFRVGTSIVEILNTVLLVFIRRNIATIILYIIYKSYREKINKNSESHKMNIKNLE